MDKAVCFIFDKIVSLPLGLTVGFPLQAQFKQEPMSSVSELTRQPTIASPPFNNPRAIYVSVTSLNDAPIGSWTHVAMSCTASTVSLYVNGVSVGTPGSYTTSAAPFISKILLFNAYTGAPNAFCGEIDHVQVYNKGLSEAQIAAAYASSATRAYAPSILASTLRVQGPCQFSQSTALDVFNTNTSNAAMTMQYTTQEFSGFDDSGIVLTSNIIDYANGAVSVSRFGPFPSTLPTEGSFLFDSYSYPGSNSSLPFHSADHRRKQRIRLQLVAVRRFYGGSMGISNGAVCYCSRHHSSTRRSLTNFNRKLLVSLH